MIELSPDAERACNQLRGSMPHPGAETRVFRRLVERPQGRQRWVLRIALVPVVLVMAGSLAYGFVGIARQVFIDSPETSRERQVAEQVKRTRSKRKLARLQPSIAPPIDSSQPPVTDAAEPSAAHEPSSEPPTASSVPSDPRATTAAAPTVPSDLRATTAAAPTLPSDPRATTAAAPTLPSDPRATTAAAPTLPSDPRATTAAVPTLVARPQASEASGVSQLDREVADYQAALALSHQDPQAALHRLQAHRRKWPSSALLHEVDLRIVQLLSAQGRKSEAQAEAQRFLERHPDSARLAEMRRIAGQATSNE